MKKVLYVILGLVVLYVVLAFVGPSHVKIEKKITINKPVESVRSHTGSYKFFHDQWSPWTELDPAMKTKYSGNPGEPGHRYEWSGNDDVRSGAMEITGMRGDSINQKISFQGQDDAKTYYIVSNANGATDFIWGIEMDMPFLFRPMLLFTDMGMNARFEKGVNNLKRSMENMKEEAAASPYAITERSWEERTYAGKRKTIKLDNHMKGLSDFMMETYPKLFSDLEKNKVTPMGPATAIYYTWNDKETDMAAMVQTDKSAHVKGWEKITLPSGRALMVSYTGPDEQSMAAHQAIMDHMRANGMEHLYVLEEYPNHHTEKDTAKWITNIYYVLK